MRAKSTAGFSLIEVTLALGLIVFCVLTLMVLMPVGLASDQQSIHQSGAANIATSILADLKNTKSGTVTTLYGLPKPASGSSSISAHTFFLDENGARSGNLDMDAIAAENPRYRADITFTPPVVGGSLQAISAHIRITWPAMADPSFSKEPTNNTGSFEVISALNRN